MKKIIVLLLSLTLFLPLMANNDKYTNYSLVGKKAPAINAKAVINDEIITITPKSYKGYYTILMFYPADFSFICPTELRAFQEKKKEFSKRNALIFGISIDQVYSHKAWLNTPTDKQGVKGITYPLISDVTKELSRAYGVLDDSGVAQRALFIINPENIVQAVIVTHDSIGRNVDEALRILSAAQAAAESEGEMCPANWHKGDALISSKDTTLNKSKKGNSNGKNS